MARDRRRLGPEEEALWTAVKKSVTPLRPEPRTPEPPPAPPVPESAATPPPDIAASSQHPVRPKPMKPAIPSLQTLDRREKKKLVRGTLEIDGRLDLHGLRQDEARARLLGFLSTVQARGGKLVLVITGKGRQGGGFEALHEPERGVLRRVVPLWLSLPEFRHLVLGFEDAHLAHGGEGALYIRIRRRKP
ncbi:Smr/MutS family protein [Chthonobacter albigriseus]|uniref:Smr/MutS family protein n=1 Tax=Chthonobacter albigriseus TaxID=1683161 RepID=UPI0015EF8981